MDVDSALLELGQQNMVLSAIITFVDYDIQYVLHLSTNVTYLKLKKQHRIQSTPKFFDSNRDGLTCSIITMFLCNNICFVFIAGIIIFLEFHCVVFFFITFDLCVKQVKKDNMVPDLLILPPSTDLHNHPLVTNGSVFMQVREFVQVWY